MTTKLFAWHGRISRGQYWRGYAAAYGGALLIVSAVAGLILAASHASGQASDTGVIVVGGLGLLAVVLLVHLLATISLFSLVVRRLHDLGASGFWALLLLLAPSPLAAMSALSALRMGEFSAPLGAPAYGLLLLAAAAVAALITVGLMPGQARDNQYGAALAR